MIRAVFQTHLRTVLAIAAVGLVSACGGGGGGGYTPPPPLPPPGPTGVTYDVVPLTLGIPGHGEIRPQGINAKGQVAGTIIEASGASHAFLYDGTTTTALGTLGGTDSQGIGISPCGHVAGWSTLADGRQHAFIYDGSLHDLGSITPGTSQAFALSDCHTAIGWSSAPGGIHAFYYNGTMLDLGTFGGNYSTAVAINASGLVTGYGYGAASAYTHGFTYDPDTGKLTEMDTLGGARSIPQALNDAGTVIGWSDTKTANSIHAFLFDGAMHDLGTLGGNSSQANWINAKGLVVGHALTLENHQHAFIYDGTMRDLGTLGGNFSDAVAINKDGLVVGSATSSTANSAVQHAMSWTQADGMKDLNKQLIGAPSGLELTEALAVSDNGSIVARSSTGEVYLLKVHQ